MYKILFKALDFSMNRIDLILLTQAFTSSTDMASSGVKENVFLATTSTILFIEKSNALNNIKTE